MNQIAYCYQRELADKPALGGKITVKFVIAKDGSVSKAATKKSTMGNTAVESCLNQRFRRFKFPEPKGGGIVIVSYPFSFEPGGSSSAAANDKPPVAVPGTSTLVATFTRCTFGDCHQWVEFEAAGGETHNFPMAAAPLRDFCDEGEPNPRLFGATFQIELKPGTVYLFGDYDFESGTCSEPYSEPGQTILSISAAQAPQKPLSNQTPASEPMPTEQDEQWEEVVHDVDMSCRFNVPKGSLKKISENEYSVSGLGINISINATYTDWFDDDGIPDLNTLTRRSMTGLTEVDLDMSEDGFSMAGRSSGGGRVFTKGFWNRFEGMQGRADGEPRWLWTQTKVLTVRTTAGDGEESNTQAKKISNSFQCTY
jgi:hypothetical protein